MASSCTRGDLAWRLGKISSWDVQSTGAGCLGLWWSHHPWISKMCRCGTKEQGLVTDWQCWAPGWTQLFLGSFPMEMILWLSQAVHGQFQRKMCISWICFFMTKTGSSVPFYHTFLFLKGCPNSSKLSWSKVIDVKKPRSFAMPCWMRKEETVCAQLSFASPG